MSALALSPASLTQLPAKADPTATFSFANLNAAVPRPIRTLLGGVAALVLLAQCSDNNGIAPTELKVDTRPKIEQRFDVENVQNFKDDIAYNGVRGIYIVKDNLTGKEYIGISGVGISETGSHSAGKTRVSDER
jgi:hypothetical protein